MNFIKLQAVMVFITAFFNVVLAQQLRGTIKSQSQEPIEGVALLYQGNVIAITDVKGTFVLAEGYKLPLTLTLKHPDHEVRSLEMNETNQTFFIKEIVSTETLKAVLVNAPYEKKRVSIVPTARIGVAELNQQSPVDVVAAINQQAGVYIQSGAINTNRIVIRGVGSRTLFGTNKIRAYFNEIPITSGVGETAIDAYNPEDLQSIEIVKGPKATQYGSSLGGTLLLTSKQSETDGVSLINSSTVGSFGLFKSASTFNYSKDKFDVHLTYDHLELDGFRENSNYNRNAVFLNSSYRFNDRTTLSLLVNFIDYTAQIPSSIGRTDFKEDPTQAAFTWQQSKGFESDAQNITGLSLKHQFSTNFTNTTSVFYTYSDHYEPRPFNILDEFTVGFGARTVFDKKFKFFNKTAEWNFGGELFKDEYHWQTIENLYQENNGNGSLQGMVLSDNEEYRQQLNIFTSMTLPILETLTVQMGVNFNTTNYDFQDEFNLDDTNTSAERNFDAIFAPNVNLVYQFNPNQSLYGNVSYGFNYPSLEETLTPEGIINPDIGPEKGFNYEVGSDLFFLKRKLHILTSLYILDIKDLLVAQRVGDDQFVGRNAGRTIHKGLELSSDYRIQISNSMSISPYVNTSFNWHKFKEFISDGSDFSGNDLTGVPDMTLATGLAFQLKKLLISANHLYVGRIPIDDANTLNSDSYNLLNMKISYDLQLLTSLNVRMNFGINNVLDDAYASSILINATGFNNSEPRYYYPGAPRNYYGGLSATYNF